MVENPMATLALYHTHTYAHSHKYRHTHALTHTYTPTPQPIKKMLIVSFSNIYTNEKGAHFVKGVLIMKNNSTPLPFEDIEDTKEHMLLLI